MARQYRGVTPTGFGRSLWGVLNMKHNPRAPMYFGGDNKFVANHGDAVWAELCDNTVTGAWTHVTTAARNLSFLKMRNHPERYLRAVLTSIRLNCEDANEPCPFAVSGTRLTMIRL
jgi:hypothetical protein